MAVVKLSGLVSNVAGKFNGSQFVRHNNQLMLQNKCRQRLEPRAKQLQHRQYFKFFANFWQTLTNTQRMDNNTAAAYYPYIDEFGDTRYYTGYALLLRSNLNLNQAGFVPIQVVPSPAPTMGSLVFNSITAAILASGVPRLTLSNSFSSSLIGTSSYIFFVSPPVSAGISVYNGSYVFQGVRSIVGSPQQNGVLRPSYWQSWQVGMRVFVKVHVIDNASGVQVAYNLGSSIIFQV